MPFAWFKTAIVVGVLITAACHKDDDAPPVSGSTAGDPTALAGTPPPASGTERPDGEPDASLRIDRWIVLEDTTYLPVIDDVDAHLLDARAYFGARDTKPAASLLREAGTLLEAEGVAVPDRRRITSAVNALNKLADRLDGGTTIPIAQVDAVLSEAYRADTERNSLVVGRWTAYADEPDRHFWLADENFLERNYRGAAAEIRKGAAFLDLEAHRATARGRAVLAASAADLEQLAVSVEHGSVEAPQILEIGFARANRALALAHHLNASEAWTSKEARRAGHELRAAASDVEHAIDWTGRDLDAGASDTVRAVGKVAGKLIQDGGYADEDVGNASTAVGRKVEQLGTRVERDANRISTDIAQRR